jgi:hypothetical protein
MKSKKIIYTATTFILLISLSFLMVFKPKNTYAGNLSIISDTLSRIEVNVDANHTIEFVTPSGVDESTDTIVLTFDDSGDAYGFTGIDFADIDLAVDDDGSCDGTWTDKTLNSTPGAGTWGVGVNTTTDVVTFTAPTDATTGEIPAGYCVQIQIGTNASGGTDAINNPNDPDSYTTDISGTFGDLGSYQVAIVTDDQIDITASVDPTLEVIISSNSCPLGTLTSNTIQTCSYDVTVSTNATSGYVSTIRADGFLRNATDDIDNASDNTVVIGQEEYGIGTSQTGQSIVQNAACTDDDSVGPSQPASPLTTTAQQFASSAGPESNDLATVCHLASVRGDTPAGNYSQVATIIVTANF